MTKILINGCPAIVGSELKFAKTPLFHIQPGTEIVVLGDLDPDYHTDHFKYPVEYSGTIQLNRAVFYAFKLHVKANELDSPTYLLYQADANLIYKTNHRTNEFLKIKPCFAPPAKVGFIKKITVIVIFLLSSLGAQAQQAETTAASDTTVHCIESKLVWTMAIAGAIIFYSENNKGEANAWRTLLGIHRKNKANYHE